MSNPHVTDSVIVCNGGGDVLEVLPTEISHPKTATHMFFDSILDEVRIGWKNVDITNDQVGETGYIDKTLEANSYGFDPANRRYISFHLTSEDGDQVMFSIFERYENGDGPIVCGTQTNQPFSNSGGVREETVIALLELVAHRDYLGPKEWVEFPYHKHVAGSDKRWKLTK